MQKITFTVLFFLLFQLNSLAQISQGGIPYAFSNSVKNTIITKIIKAPNISQTTKNEELRRAYVGKIIPVDINIENSGSWQIVKGGMLWQLKIIAKRAKALSIYYNEFELPKGAKLFLYNSKKTTVIGSFTNKNNADGGFFATTFTEGESVILEYFVPTKAKTKGKISINEVNYAYQNIQFTANKSGFGTSDVCQININCKQTIAWDNEKNSVVRWLSKNKDGSWWCSGTIINNGNQDYTPYILSSEHNILDNNYMPTDKKYYEQFQFYFNYESASCENPTDDSKIPNNSMIGCTLKARSGAKGEIIGSDFILLELLTEIPDSYTPFFAGWTRENLSIDSGYCIHHPQGDIKKISKSNSTLSTAKYGTSISYWSTNWQIIGEKTGITEAGSSGSALFNLEKRIVGTLTSGSSSCSEPNNNDFFGKFSYHWESNGQTADRQLKTWLDPNNLGIISIDGVYTNENSVEFITENNLDLNLYPNPTKDILSINLNSKYYKELFVEIYNFSGIKIQQINFRNTENSVELNISDLPKGMYIFRISDGNKSISRKVIKQ